MHTFFWYFITQSICINYTIELFYFSFYLFFIINRIIMKFYAFNFFDFIPNKINQYNIMFNHKWHTFSTFSKILYVSTHLR